MKKYFLTHFMALVSFYITRKYQKTNHGGVLVTPGKVIFWGYRKRPVP